MGIYYVELTAKCPWRIISRLAATNITELGWITRLMHYYSCNVGRMGLSDATGRSSPSGGVLSRTKGGYFWQLYNLPH